MSTGEPAISPSEIDRTRKHWLKRLGELIGRVEAWAQQLDWSTRAIEKRMQDSVIGEYQAPALLLQQDAIRLFLEPISHSTPGSEGVVDLYAMPAYDDIASIYYAEGTWHVHYPFEDSPLASKFDKSDSQPLSQEKFTTLLNAMKIHAGSIT